MPFGDTEHSVEGQKIITTSSEWNHIFEKWIKKAVESFKPHRFQCNRSPAPAGNFIKGIVEDLSRSCVVIFDRCDYRARAEMPP